MNLEKPNGLVSQIAVYTDDITRLRYKGYTWAQLAALVAIVDSDLGKRIAKNTVIRSYYLRALKKLADGTLIVEQESLTKGKRGPKPKVKESDSCNTPVSAEPEYPTMEHREARIAGRNVPRFITPAKPPVITEPAKSIETITPAKPAVVMEQGKPAISDTGAPTSVSIIEKLRDDRNKNDSAKTK
jgi:hypothetical protein